MEEKSNPGLPQDYIEDCCPACGEIVEFSQQQLATYDGHHMECACPHCGKFCCFVCGHVYGEIVMTFGCDPDEDRPEFDVYSHIWNPETGTIDTIGKDGKIVGRYLP